MNEKETMAVMQDYAAMAVSGRHLAHWADDVAAATPVPWPENIRRLHLAAEDWKNTEWPARQTLDAIAARRARGET